MLADGRVVLLRPLCPDDQDIVRRLHEQLSERDSYFRFFGPPPRRLGDLIFRMCAPVSLQHGSMGAFLEGDLVGVGHYEVLADSTTAEVAMAVSDTARRVVSARCCWNTWSRWPGGTVSGGSPPRSCGRTAGC